MFLPLSSPFTASIFFLPPTLHSFLFFLALTVTLGQMRSPHPGLGDYIASWALHSLCESLCIYCQSWISGSCWLVLVILLCYPAQDQQLHWSQRPPGNCDHITQRPCCLYQVPQLTGQTSLTHCLLYVMDKTTYFPCSLGGEWPTFWFNALGIIVPQETKQTCNWDGSCFPHSVHTPYLSGGED